MAPQSGNINIFVTTTTSGGTGASSSGGGGGRSPRGTAPGRAPQGSPNNPTFVQGTVSFIRLFSPLLALYAIDRTLRAMGLTSSVLNTWIRALGAVWSAIADTLLLPLMPVFTQLLDWSMKGLAWIQNNWPRMVENIGKWLGDIKLAIDRKDAIGGFKALFGGFMQLDWTEKLAVLLAARLGIGWITGALKFLIGFAVKTPGVVGAASVAQGLGYAVGTTLPIIPVATAAAAIYANRPTVGNPNYRPGQQQGIYGPNTPWLFRPGAMWGHIGKTNNTNSNSLSSSNTIIMNVNLAQVDELSQANQRIQKQTEEWAKEQYRNSQWLSDAGH